MNAPAEAFRCQALAKEIAAELRVLDVPTSILLSADELIEQEYRNARRLDRRRQQWVTLGHSAMSARCPVCPKADSAGTP